MDDRQARAVASAVPRPECFLYEGDLPEAALDLVRMVGTEGAVALIRELGGVPFPVPKGADNNRQGAARYERLAEIVGDEGAAAIVREYGDCVLNVPTCRNAFARATRRAMAAFFDAGATLEEIALAYGCTTRWVSMALKNFPPASGKRVMFHAGGTREP